MGEHWDPWNQGASPDRGRWGPPGGSPAPPGDRGGGFIPPGGAPAGAPAPGGYVPGGFTPESLGTSVPGFVDPPSSSFDGTDPVGTPPWAWLLAALVVGLVAVVIALTLGASVLYAVGAWLLAGPVAIGLLAVFTQQDVRRRSLPIYAAPHWLPALYWSAVAVAGVGVLASAWNIAEWAGRQ